MSNEEQVGSPEEQINEHFKETLEAGWRFAEAVMREKTPSVLLAVQAMRAEEIRTELREIVFSEEVSSEDWAAWALMYLSPYTDAEILATADLTVTRHNIKTLFQKEGF